jgi:hypothetical protein
MGSSIENICVDCSDPYELGRWWSRVLDLPLSPEDHPGDPEASIELGNGRRLLFLRVPEPKTVKNRLHFCLRPDVPATRRWSGCSESERRWSPTDVTRTARGGPCSAIPRATSSASFAVPTTPRPGRDPAVR